MSLLRKINNLLTKRDKQNLFLLLIFSIVVSAVEMFSISVVMPFISVSTNFDLVKSNVYYKRAYDFFGYNKPSQFVIALGVLLIIFFLFKNILNVVFTVTLNKYSQGKYKTFAYNVFQKYLKSEYGYFTKENSSSVHRAVFSDANALTQVIISLLQIATEGFTAIFIYIMLLYVNWSMTVFLTCLVVVISVFLFFIFSSRLSAAGKNKGEAWKVLNQTISECVGNFKLIKLFSNQSYFFDKFEKASNKLARSNVMNSTFQELPKVFLEGLGFVFLIGLIVYIVWRYKDPKLVLPLVSIYALACYKLLPSISRMFYYYNQMIFSIASLGNFSTDINKFIEFTGESKVLFKQVIKLDSIVFSHDENKFLLNNICLKINKGERVAFVGDSGCGKSTLLDIFMGFYTPQRGHVFIDNAMLGSNNLISWRSQIGYIPQDVYLLDGTVAENVVLGRDYDESRLISVLIQSKIYDFLTTKDGINTLVGEGGVMLSGGQKQRIAIARALYSSPDILILDEATSALDSEIEAKIMDEVYNLSKDKTLIIVAHRLSTVARCDKVYKVEYGKVELVKVMSESLKIKIGGRSVIESQ